MSVKGKSFYLLLTLFPVPRIVPGTWQVMKKRREERKERLHLLWYLTAKTGLGLYFP